MAKKADQRGETGTWILARLFDDADGLLPKEVARYVMTLGFSDSDKARMHDLLVRNQDDALSLAEKEEMIEFGKAGCLLGILKSKARRRLGIKLEIPKR